MSNSVLKQVETEDGMHRISVYYDEYAECPCTAFDQAFLCLFTYTDSKRLHKDCNWSETECDSNSTMLDALCNLVCQHCDITTKEFTEFIKYDGEDKLCDYDFSEFAHSELECNDLITALQKFGKDIVVTTFELIGYCQGEYVKVVAYCTKERFTEMVSGNTDNWVEDLMKLVPAERTELNAWMWGTVYSVSIEKKVNFTKTYGDGTTLEDYEWVEEECIGGYYMESVDECIELVLENIQ